MSMCAIVAALPLGLCGAFMLGALWGERKHVQVGDAMRVTAPPIEQLARGDVPVKALPSSASGVPTIRMLPAPRRARSSSRRHAMQVAQRWFR